MSFLREKQDIIDWLDQYGVKNYELVADERYGYVVNVNGDLYLQNYWLSEICVKFNKVSGFFDCSGNMLTTLSGAPDVVGTDYNCSKNKLTSLKGVPDIIHGDFKCTHNKLTTLEFCPSKIGKEFSAITNDLKNLIFFPKSVGSSTYFWNNEDLKLTQYEHDFNRLYQLHRLQFIEYHANTLEDKLNSNQTISINSDHNSRHKL